MGSCQGAYFMRLGGHVGLKPAWAMRAGLGVLVE